MLQLSIVVPTFNEKDNVGRLVEGIQQILAGVEHEIVFVDDSTDETPEIIEGMQKKCPHIRLIHRQGKDRQGGLGTAVLRGFKEAQGEYLCVMDADLQHPPSMVSKLFEEAQSSGSDIVIGSRYLKGGGYEGLKGPFRKFFSIACKEFARAVFFPRLKDVTEPLSGLFLVHRRIVEERVLKPKGFKILLEVLIRCNWTTAREMPYHFTARAGGESKANMKQGFTFLRHVGELFWTVPGAGRFWKFALVGSSGVGVNLGILWTLVQAGLMEPVAWAVAIEASIINNYLLNQVFTFRDRPFANFLHLCRRFTGFNVASWGAIASNGAVMFALRYLDVPLLAAALAAIAVTMVFNYAASTKLVFRGMRDPVAGSSVRRA